MQSIGSVPSRVLVGCAALALGACVGQIARDAGGGAATNGSGAGGTTQASACSGERSPGPAFVRRLNRFEYANTVRDLLGVEVATDAFPPDDKRLGFDDNAVALTVSPALAEQHLLAAEAAARKAVEQQLPMLAPCAATAKTSADEEACATSFVGAFGRRAFRRPLTSDERARAMTVYQAGRADADLRSGLRLVVESFLLAPAFLYRLESNASTTGKGPRALDGYEVATRLSYLLWGSTPDDALLAAAEAGRLATDADVQAQATRLLADPRATAAVQHFLEQWLQLDKVAAMEKDASAVRGWAPELRASMLEEARRFVADVAGPGGSVTGLLSASHSFVDRKLAAFYGLPAPAGDGFVRVAKASAGGGVLTHAPILAMLAKADQTDPVHRGKFVREQLLCGELPPPPPNVEIVAPALSATLTTRERFSRHATDAACAACHTLMDPIGLGLEGFDAAGRARSNENGRPIDASGRLVETDVDGDFDGATELAARLAGSAQVRTCLARQWFRYAFGRAETDADACTMARLASAAGKGDGSFADLYRAPLATDAFRYRADNGGAP